VSTATEADIAQALRDRYGQQSGNGQRYAFAAHVRSHAGFDANRTADFVAMDLWPSQGLALHGHEIKVSRADWLRELKEPEKAEEFIPYMNHWWLAVPDAALVRDGELPDGWGLMVVRNGRIAVTRKAPRRDALPMPPTRLAALLRAVAVDARNHQPPVAGLENATAGDLHGELAKARSETGKLRRQLDKANDEATAWRDAYAVQGHLPCAHCGRPVKPNIRSTSGWRHVTAADEAKCVEIRPHRWSPVYPADDAEPPLEAS